jgi:hypothetical protein
LAPARATDVEDHCGPIQAPFLKCSQGDKELAMIRSLALAATLLFASLGHAAESRHQIGDAEVAKSRIASFNGAKRRDGLQLVKKKTSEGKSFSGGSDGWYQPATTRVAIKRGRNIVGHVDLVHERNTTFPGHREEHFMKIRTKDEAARNAVLEALQ